MKTLKTLALIGASALAVSAVSTAAVQAQPYGGYGYGHREHVDTRLSPANIDRLAARLDYLARARLINWNQAHHLKQDLMQVRPLAWRAENGRANSWEIRRLRDTIFRVEAESSRYASNDRGRYYGYDRNHDGRDSDGDGYDRDSGWRR